MRKKLLTGALAIAAIGAGVAPAASQAAEENQLCYTNAYGYLYINAITITGVPAGSLVRILGFRGGNYLIRYGGNQGQFDRALINQATCYYQ